MIANNSRKAKKVTLTVVLYTLICLLLFVNIYPFLMLVFGAVKDDVQFYNSPFWAALPLNFAYMRTVIPIVWRYVLNTVIIAVVGIAGNLLISGISAYVFARLKFVGKEVLFLLIIALMMIPSILSIIPTYRLYLAFGLDNTLAALFLPMIATGPIFGVFLLRSFFGGIPEDVFEAARVDGCNEVQSFFKICIPLSLPIIGTLAIMNTISVWNDVIWPQLINNENAVLNIGAGLKKMFDSMTGAPNYPYLFSAYLLASLPMILLFFFTTKYYIEGLSSSGLKM